MSAPILSFTPFRLDPADGCLWRGSQRLMLSPTDFGVLYHLAAHAGQLVTHADLLAAVWPETVVGKGILKVRVHRLRQVLGDHADQPQFIETAQRRGYRFVAAVSDEPPAPPSPQSADSRRTAAPVVPATTFVGRESEMATLRAALDDAAAGSGGLVLLTGEPGIGKTRLAEELAAIARADGAEVLIGGCHEGHGTPPFWPWVRILRAHLGAHEPGALARRLGREAAQIARLIPEVRDVLPDVVHLPALDSEHARFALFDALATFLKRIAKRTALVVVLDDLHWADTPSLLLLQFVARELTGTRALLIAIHREMRPTEEEHPLTPILGELARLPRSRRLALTGLGAADVARFVTVATGATPSTALVASLCAATDGNPFFVTEVVQAMAHDDRVARAQDTDDMRVCLPQRVREAITRRLSTLSARCRRVLTTAAVIGREFSITLLGAALAAEPTFAGDKLFAVLDEASAGNFIMAQRTAVGRYTFCHGLIRQTLYEGLSPARRMRLHRQIGELLEQQSAANGESVITELASHFYLAVPSGGDYGKAIEYATRAGHQAMTALAYEEAVRQYQRALQILELRPEGARRCELLLTMGAAQRQAGQSAAARETFAAAARLARSRAAEVGTTETAPLLARAALGLATGFAGVSATGGVADTFVLDLLEEALCALGENDSPLRARVLGRLAVELYYADQPERCAVLSTQAVEMARRCSDHAALAYTLNARSIAVWGPDTVQERLEVSAEIMRLADEVGDRDLSLRGHMRRLGALLELGELRTADREIAVYAQRARALRQPSHLWFLAAWQAMRAGMAGAFDRAETFARDALAIGERAQDPDARQCFTVQIFAIRSGGKGLAEVELPARTFATEYAAVPAWRAGIALLYADLGQEALARQELDQLAANDFADLPRDADWMVSMASLAQLCAYLRDGPRAALLYERLKPYAARNVVVGHGLVCLGSVERFLALLAAAQRRWEEAEAHFAVAITRNRQLGAKPLVALAQREHATMLMTRNEKGDRARAMRILDESLALSRQLGMEDQIRRVLALKAAEPAAPPALAVLAGRGGRTGTTRGLRSRDRSRRG